jgi:uncharacterized membrane protein YukC
MFEDFEKEFDKHRKRVSMFLWFAIGIKILIVATIVFFAFSIITNPKIVGEFLGEIYSGFTTSTDKGNR